MTTVAPTIGTTNDRSIDRPLLRRAALLAGQFGRAMRAARCYRSASQDPRAATRMAFREIAG